MNESGLSNPQERRISALLVEDMQIRQGHWAIVDLVGTGGHIRTVPMPDWVIMSQLHDQPADAPRRAPTANTGCAHQIAESTH